MKKVLTGAILMGAMATATFSEGIESAKSFDPTGTVEVGFEWEEYDSSNDAANQDFILPYVKTQTHFNQTTPYYIEANYSYRKYFDTEKRGQDRRERYELFVGGYKYTNGKFAWTPKVGFRDEEYSDAANRSRTYWRIYPGLTYDLTERAQLYVGGYFAPVTDDRDSGQEETTYRHELEFGVKYKLTDKDVLKTNIFSDVEYFEIDGDESKKNTEYQLWLRLDHQFDDGKTAAYVFARIGLYRDTDYKSGSGTPGRETDKARKRNRYGIGGSRKLNDSFSVLSEVYYESAGNGSVYEENKAKNRLENTNKMFVKLGLRYSY